MLALLSSLAEALRLFLVIKAYRARWDLTNDIDSDLQARRDEIERLRSSAVLADRDRAERLLRLLEARNGLANDFRAAVNPPGKGGADPDKGRNVLPAAGRNLAQPPTVP